MWNRRKTNIYIHIIIYLCHEQVHQGRVPKLTDLEQSCNFRVSIRYVSLTLFYISEGADDVAESK